MSGYDTNEGHRDEPFDNRDAEDPEFTIDPVLSSSNTDFGGEDPAVRDPEPKEEIAPAWNHEDDNIEA